MSEFWDKIISMEFGTALLGALVGGGFTLLGSWWQSRSADKATALAQAKANAQRALDALTRLRAHMDIQSQEGMGSREQRDAWNREREMLIASAQSSVMLLPDAYEDTRTPVTNTLGEIKNWYGLPIWIEYQMEVRLLLDEAINFLGLFFRGSKAPQPRNMNAIITKAIEDHRREMALSELTALNNEGAHRGLDPEDEERARELRDFLGLPHPPEPTTDDDSAS